MRRGEAAEAVRGGTRRNAEYAEDAEWAECVGEL